jgi:hypothetical protein
MRCFVPVAAAILFGLSSNAVADADSLTDSLGPRAIAVGESLRAQSVGSLSTVLNPAGLALNRQLVFEGSYGFRNEDSASIANISACDSTTPIAGCFYYHYMTAGPETGGMKSRRRFHEGGVSAARALTPQLLLGTNTRYFDYNSDLMDEEDADGFTVDVGLIFVPTKIVNIAAVGYNLIGTKSVQYPRAAATGVTVRPGSGALGINLDAVWKLQPEEGEKTGRYGGGLEYFLSSGDGAAGYPLRVGGVHDVSGDRSYFTIGAGFASAKVGLDIGARRQIGDEQELVIQAGLRLAGPTMQAQQPRSTGL